MRTISSKLLFVVLFSSSKIREYIRPLLYRLAYCGVLFAVLVCVEFALFFPVSEWRSQTCLLPCFLINKKNEITSRQRKIHIGFNRCLLFIPAFLLNESAHASAFV